MLPADVMIGFLPFLFSIRFPCSISFIRLIFMEVYRLRFCFLVSTKKCVHVCVFFFVGAKYVRIDHHVRHKDQTANNSMESSHLRWHIVNIWYFSCSRAKNIIILCALPIFFFAWTRNVCIVLRSGFFMGSLRKWKYIDAMEAKRRGRRRKKRNSLHISCFIFCCCCFVFLPPKSVVYHMLSEIIMISISPYILRFKSFFDISWKFMTFSSNIHRNPIYKRDKIQKPLLIYLVVWQTRGKKMTQSRAQHTVQKMDLYRHRHR